MSTSQVSVAQCPVQEESFDIRLDVGTQLASVLDVICGVLKCVPRASSQALSRIASNLPELTDRIENVRINGEGHETPVADAKTLIKLLLVLPGVRAASVRLQTMSRYHATIAEIMAEDTPSEFKFLPNWQINQGVDRETFVCDVCEEPKSKKAKLCRECWTEYLPFFRSKESKFAAALQASLSEYALYTSRDQVLQCADGSRRRPDFTYVLPRHMLIIELDENYHRSYDLLDEMHRLMEIADTCKAKHQMKALNVLRVNAEDYDMDKVLTIVQRMCTTYTPQRINLHYIGYPMERFYQSYQAAEEINTGAIGDHWPFNVVGNLK